MFQKNRKLSKVNLFTNNLKYFSEEKEIIWAKSGNQENEWILAKAETMLDADQKVNVLSLNSLLHHT